MVLRIEHIIGDPGKNSINLSYLSQFGIFCLLIECTIYLWYFGKMSVQNASDYAQRTKWKVNDSVMIFKQNIGRWCPRKITKLVGDDDIQAKYEVILVDAAKLANSLNSSQFMEEKIYINK